MPEVVIAVLGLAFLTTLLAFVPCRTTAARAAVSAAFAVTTGAYVAWRLVAWQFRAHTGGAAAYQVIYLAFEFLGLGYDLFCAAYLIRRSDRRAAAAECVRRLRERQDRPLVAVLIPSASEPAEVVSRTLTAVAALNWPRHRLVVVLGDDGKISPNDEKKTVAEKLKRRAALEAVCVRLRLTGLDVRYHRRADSRHAKAGNLNAAWHILPAGVAYLGVLDADHHPTPDWLETTVAYLEGHADVGVLQVPQTYRNPDIAALNLFAPWAIPENQNAFMRAVQPSRDSYGVAFCVGSGFVVRASLVRELGGFPGDTLAEDLTLTLAGLSRGYQTHFLAEKLTHGLAPQSVAEFIGQQCRWAVGSVQHLLHRFGPLRNPNLSWVQRVLFLELIAFWMTYITLALALLAPAVYWITGVPAVPNRHAAGMALLMFVRWLARELSGYALTDGRSAPVFGMAGRVIACFPVTAVVLLALAFPGKAWRWHVTGKNVEPWQEAAICWPAVRPLLYLASVTALGLLANWSGAVGFVPACDITAGNLAWTFGCLAVLGLAALACVDQPWDPKNDHPDREAHRFHPRAALRGLARRLVS